MPLLRALRCDSAKPASDARTLRRAGLARSAWLALRLRASSALRVLVATAAAAVVLTAAPDSEAQERKRDAPQHVTPADVPPFLEITRITPAQHAGAVSFAMESMRLVHGELTPAEEKRFQAQWMPLFQHCTAEVLAWFNRLNPLLGQFLRIRAALSGAAQAFDEAQQDAVGAFAAGNAEALARALDAAELARRQMRSLLAALERTVADIDALGGPPDVAGNARRRRDAHDAAMRGGAATGDAVRIDWREPPAGWNEEAQCWTDRWRYVPRTSDRDRHMILNGRKSENSGSVSRVEFQAADDPGRATLSIQLSMTPYPSVEDVETAVRRGPDADPDAPRERRIALECFDGFATRSHARAGGKCGTHTLNVEPTRLFGHPALRSEFLCSNDSLDDGWLTRSERRRVLWFAVDIGLADRSCFLSVMCEQVLVQNFATVHLREPDPELSYVSADDVRAFAHRRAPERWRAMTALWDREMWAILDSVSVRRIERAGPEEVSHLVAELPVRTDTPPPMSRHGEWVRIAEKGPRGRCTVTRTVPLEVHVREATLDGRPFPWHENGVTAKSEHEWTEPPEHMPFGWASTISVDGSAVTYSLASDLGWTAGKDSRGNPDRRTMPRGTSVAESDLRGKGTRVAVTSYDFLGNTGTSVVRRIPDAETARRTSARDTFQAQIGRADTKTGPCFADGGAGEVVIHAWQQDSHLGGDMHWAARAKDAGEVRRLFYLWDWNPRRESSGAEASEVPGRAAAPSPEDEQAAAESRGKAAQVEFHVHEIEVRESALGELRRLASSARPEQQEEFRRRIMWEEDWIQRARDAITTLRTGNFTRTRTACDAFNLSVMESESRATAEKWDTVRRLASRGPHLIALAPEPEQARLREFLEKQTGSDALATGDAERFRRVISALGNRVMGSLEQAQGRAASDLVDADERLAAAERTKYVAEQSLAAISVGGGALGAGSTVLDAVSGWVEHGPAEGTKRILSKWNQATEVASEVIDAVQASILAAYEQHASDARYTGAVDEVRAGLGGAGWVLGRTALLELGQKFIVEPLGKQVLGTPDPPRKKTLGELALEMQYLKRRAEGMDTVRLFQERLGEAARAAAAGAPAADLARLHAEANEVYRLIKTDWFAKQAINEAGRGPNARLLRQYLQFDRAAMEQLRTAMDARQARSGISPQNYRLFSNSASRCRAGMDIDFGVEEPPRWILDGAGKQVPNPARADWVRNLAPGRPGGMSLGEFREESQRNLNAAFQEVFGFDPTKSAGREAFVNFTTGDHPEAFRDRAWLGRLGLTTADFSAIDPKWASQAGAVTSFKVNTLPQHHPGFGYFATLQEQCRGTVKDFDTKLMPILGRARNETAVAHMRELREVMQSFATNEIGPVEANQRILELTGGRGICEVAQQYETMLTVLAGGR